MMKAYEEIKKREGWKGVEGGMDKERKERERRNIERRG